MGKKMRQKKKERGSREKNYKTHKKNPTVPKSKILFLRVLRQWSARTFGLGTELWEIPRDERRGQQKPLKTHTYGLPKN